jgi:hypothetical protein
VKLLLLLVAACGPNPAVKAVEELAAAVCTCPDKACADDALAKGAEKLAAMKDPKGTEGDLKAVEAAKARMQDCQKKLQ